jgi:predicted ABC-type ATPase
MTPLDARPIIVAIAGPNGAGKSTFYETYLRDVGLRFVNADDIARHLGLGPYEAAKVADALRHELVEAGESFIFETVFSDPHGEKVAFLRDAADRGYTVVLFFIGLDAAATSEIRVSMRVLQGGHDVPSEKLLARYERSLANLARAIAEVPHVSVYDNADLRTPYRKIADFELGKRVALHEPIPAWMRGVLGNVDRQRRDDIG